VHVCQGRPTEAYAAFCGQLPVGWLSCEPADPQAKGRVDRPGERIGRMPAAADRSLPIAHQPLRQRADPLKAAAQPPQDVRRFLGEDQRPGDHPATSMARGHHPPTTQLPMADRDRLPGLPQIALHQLPG
jgi:hypothetical protein